MGEPGWTVACLGRNRGLSCCQYPEVRPGQQSAGKVEEQKPSVSMWPEWVERGRENFPGAKILWRNAEEGKFCTRSVVMEPDGGPTKFREPARDRGALGAGGHSNNVWMAKLIKLISELMKGKQKDQTLEIWNSAEGHQSTNFGVRLWTSYLNSVSLRFLICKMGIMAFTLLGLLQWLNDQRE